MSFGNNAKGYVLEHGTISSGRVQFDKVNLVENLKYNLQSVSQMCDKDIHPISPSMLVESSHQKAKC